MQAIRRTPNAKPAPRVCVNCEHLTMDAPDDIPAHLLMIRCNAQGWAWNLKIVRRESFNTTDVVTPNNCPKQ